MCIQDGGIVGGRLWRLSSAHIVSKDFQGQIYLENLTGPWKSLLIKTTIKNVS